MPETRVPAIPAKRTASEEEDRPPRPIVPRRRIPARVRLSDGSTIAGELYAAVPAGEPRQQTIADRLNDREERFLPMACGERHVLLRKAGIVCAEIPWDEVREDGGDGPSLREFRVCVSLADGVTVEGTLQGRTEAIHYRTLDHLNAMGRGFFPLRRERDLVLLHTDHVLAVREIRED